MLESSNVIGVKICNLCGLDPKLTKSIEIKFDSTDVVIITAEVYPTQTDLDKFAYFFETTIVKYKIEKLYP